jgi:hypothetical protein
MENFDDSKNKEQEIKSMIESFSEEDRELLEKYTQLPNVQNIQPEVMRLIVDYGEKFNKVSDRIEETRQKLGINYNDLREEMLKQLGK